MCRWIAYSGEAIFLDNLITKPQHSLVVQSLDTKMNIHSDGQLMSLNIDGSGIGWYSGDKGPGRYRSILPAASDENLKSLCENIKSHLFLAHVRAATSGVIQQGNSHPFKHAKWLFQHNGDIANFDRLKQRLQMEIARDLFPYVKGSTDSETFFYLALTFGLDKNPLEALRKAVSLIIKICEEDEIEASLNFSCALSNGEKLYTMLYAHNEPHPKTQFYSRNNACAKDLGADKVLLPEDSIVFVSEPLDEMSVEWEKVPENSFITVEKGNITRQEFMLS